MTKLQRFITEVDLRNFRAFESEKYQCAPITIFVGPNNSGKSSALSAIRLLSQTLQSADLEVPLLLGPFGTYRDVVFGNISTRVLGIGIQFTYGESKSASIDVNFKYRAQRREVILRDCSIYDSERKPLIRTQYSRDSEKQTIRHLADIDLGQSPFSRPLRVVHFLPRMTFMRLEAEKLRVQQKLPLSQVRGIFEVDRISKEASWLLQNLEYLGPIREVPLRGYPFSGERPSTVGATGRGAPDILVADYFRRGSRKRELSNSVRDWLANAGIASDMQVRPVSERQYEIRFQHPKTGEYENLADVGYGISQIVPVIVGGQNLNPGSIFMVEQPEIHLHPRAQSELGDFVFNLYQRGIQSIIETHSEHLILRIQTRIAEGQISPEDVAVNFVKAGEKRKEIVRLPINGDGIFETEWPEGFFAERLSEALDLARAPLRRKS